MTTPKGGANHATDYEIAERITNALIINNITMRTLSDEIGLSYAALRRRLKPGPNARIRSLSFQEFTQIAATIDIQPSVLLPATLTGKAA